MHNFIATADTATKNKLNTKCCPHVKLLITPPHEHGTREKTCSNTNEVYSVNKSIRFKDTNNEIKRVRLNINPTEINISTEGTTHLKKETNDCGNTWLCRSAVNCVKLINLESPVYKNNNNSRLDNIITQLFFIAALLEYLQAIPVEL